MSHTSGKIVVIDSLRTYRTINGVTYKEIGIVLSNDERLLEKEVVSTNQRLVACWNEHDDLVKERDELVGILRRTVKYANRKPFNLTKEIDAVLTKYPEAS